MDTCPASENLNPLRRELFTRAGIMLTVHAGSRTLWWSLAKLDPAAEFPSSSGNNFFDCSYVWMNGYPILPVFDVHAVY